MLDPKLRAKRGTSGRTGFRGSFTSHREKCPHTQYNVYTVYTPVTVPVMPVRVFNYFGSIAIVGAAHKPPISLCYDGPRP